MFVETEVEITTWLGAIKIFRSSAFRLDKGQLSSRFGSTGVWEMGEF